MSAIFSVQDETGTVTQLTLLPSPSPSLAILPGDTGIYSGIPDDGNIDNAQPAFQALAFTVTQVLDNEHFSVHTTNANMADWPAGGDIEWTTGNNIGEHSTVIEIDGANAYMNEDDFAKYHTTRGNAVPVGATVDQIRAAIVKGTDYLDHRYRYSGIKLLQSVGVAPIDANAAFATSWLTPYAVRGISYLTPYTTTQTTEWPRQGVTDLSGDTVFGIPRAIKDACAELAIRVLNGTNLQPDYDPTLVSAGGVVSSVTKKVGPLEKVVSYDTKFGLGFFATFPIVDRLLKSAGLLSSGGQRTVMR